MKTNQKNPVILNGFLYEPTRRMSDEDIESCDWKTKQRYAQIVKRQNRKAKRYMRVYGFSPILCKFLTKIGIL